MRIEDLVVVTGDGYRNLSGTAQGAADRRLGAVAGASIGPATGSPPRLIRAPSSGKTSVERIAAPTRPAAVEVFMCPASIASVVIATTRGSSVAE